MTRKGSRHIRLSLVAAMLAALSASIAAQDNSNGAPDPSKAANLGTVNVPGYSLGQNPPTPPPIFIAPPTFPVPIITGNDGHDFQPPPGGPSTVLAKNATSPCPKGDPVLPDTGTKIETYPFFALPGEMGLRYVMYYNSSRAGYAGGDQSWRDNLLYFLDTNCTGQGQCNTYTLHRPDGSTATFPAVYSGTVNEQGGGIATLSYSNDASGVYTVHDEDGTTQTYPPGHLLGSIVDASGVGWTVSTNGSTKTVTHTNGQHFTVTYGGTATTVTDPAGNVYTIQGYSLSGRPTSIVYPGTPQTTIGFKYDPTVNMLSEVDYNGSPYAYTTYITSASQNPHVGWATSTYFADGSGNTALAYGQDSGGHLVTTITNPLGFQEVENYDGNNNLTTVSGSAVQTCGATVSGRTYDANKHMSAEIDNNGNTHAYTYAANGQLQTETEAYGTALARTTDYVWDSNAQLNRLLSKTVEGWKKTTYTYNAQNRLASVTYTNLSSNGSANQALTITYSYVLYANGTVQSKTEIRPSPSGTNTTTSNYDALGNLTSLVNGLGQATTYSNYNGLGEPGHIAGPNGDAVDFTYDGRGRVLTKTTYPNGTAATWTSAYDGFGLLYTLTGPDGQVTTWNRDPSSMRVTSINHNDKDGASTETFGYDLNGDVLEHKISRGSTIGLDEISYYDALGRVYRKVGQNGQTRTYAYDGNGNVLSIVDSAGHTTAFQYDALDRITQKSESGGSSPSMPTSAPTINVPSSNSSGTYTVSWNSISAATFYPLQEQVGSGGWSTVQNNSALNWSPNLKASNTYSYRVQACNATGCSPWSSVGSVVVSIPTAPTTAPSLTAPSSSATGNYSVTWTNVSNASAYTVQEQVNGGAWTTIQNNAGLNWSVIGETNGTYAYRVEACNSLGCGPWSNTGTTVVTWPVPAVPAGLSAPSYTTSANYTVSWNSVPYATSYVLNAAPSGGSWTTVSNGSATSWAASGQGNSAWTYAVSACDASGCSAFSSAISTTLTVPAPLPLNGKSYSATNVVKSGTGNELIGVDIVSGNTWEVFKSQPGNPHVVLASGTLPFGSANVQFTWTDAGVPAGATNANGSVTNGASSQVAVSSNPTSSYLTASFNATGDHAHQYSVRIDLFNGGGQNMSSSTVGLTAEVMGPQ